MADRRAFAPLERDPRTGEPLPPAVREQVQDCARTMMALIRNIEAYRRRLASTVGVNVTELRALGRIAEAETTTPSNLADDLGLTTGSVTPLLDRLEQAGYLERVRHPSDRRSVQLELTERGVDTIRRSYATFQDRLLAAVQAMSPEAVAAVEEFLRLASEGYKPVEEPGPDEGAGARKDQAPATA